MYLAALPLLAATLSRSPVQISMVIAATWVPWLLFGLVSGAVADRWDRLRIMVVADGVRFGALVVVAVALWSQAVSIGVLVAAAFLLLLGGHNAPFESLPVLATSFLGLFAAAFDLLDPLLNLSAHLLDPLIAFPSLPLQLHVEIVPEHDARDYTSDKKLCNEFYSASCQGVRMRGPWGVTATVNSKWAAREPSSE